MGTRTLILVRHGQYHLDGEHARYGRLTALGERQSKRLAKRLAGYPIDAVHTSTAPRAIETAAFVLQQLRTLAPKSTPALLEGFPTVFEGISREQRLKVAGHRTRMERAFKRYFRATRGRDRTELLVCHGNIIRFFVRRALGDSPHKWSHAAIMHCGISIVVVSAKGARIYALNDVGHLPHAMQTFS